MWQVTSGSHLLSLLLSYSINNPQDSRLKIWRILEALEVETQLRTLLPFHSGRKHIFRKQDTAKGTLKSQQVEFETKKKNRKIGKKELIEQIQGNNKSASPCSNYIYIYITLISDPVIRTSSTHLNTII